jgi:hypothetical protein
LGRVANRQVRAQDERDLIKAVAISWFNDQRRALAEFDPAEYVGVDAVYQALLRYCEAAITRARYLDELGALKKELVSLRARLVAGRLKGSTGGSTDRAPDFSTLVADEKMRAILIRRWNETRTCLGAAAHLAATVMMGGLLEALFLARVNKTAAADKAALFKSKAAPKDDQGKTAQLKEWTLRDFIDVAHDVGWIAHSAKDVSVVLRDWRNYIHPQKELSHNVEINARETTLLMERLRRNQSRAPARR